MNEQKHEDQSSGIKKAPTGIEGFDEIANGGLPRGRTTLLIGGPGCGKTLFSLQTLVNGARLHNEPGIFVALEENSRQIIENASSFGWDLPGLQGNQLYFLDAKMPAELTQAGVFDLEGLLASVTAKVVEIGAKRIVFDGIDMLLDLLNNPAAERREVHRLHEWLVAHELTGIITAKIPPGEVALEERYSFMQYVIDCIVQLRQVVVTHIALRKLRIIKYRGSSFFENEAPMLIGPRGIEVVGPGLNDLEFAVSNERLSTGVAELDTMLNGGYLRGSAILLTGAPGTAKSTLAGAFAQAACARGEPTLYVTFDENANELLRNLHSVDLHLEGYVESGLLTVQASRVESQSAEAHLLHLRSLIRTHKPRCLVLDPITALLKGGGEAEAMAVAQRLFAFAKAEGITILVTNLLAGAEPEMEEAARFPIATIADAWIHVSYVNQGGERNRALTVVKARGTKHSKQVRELLLDENGLRLVDVYTAGGAVLMGTLRWEKEQAALQEKAAQRQLTAQRRLELQANAAELAVRLVAVQCELDARQAELAQLSESASDQEEDWTQQTREAQMQRTVQHDEPSTSPVLEQNHE